MLTPEPTAERDRQNQDFPFSFFLFPFSSLLLSYRVVGDAESRTEGSDTGLITGIVTQMMMNASTWNEPASVNTTPYPKPRSSSVPTSCPKTTPPRAPPNPTRPATAPIALRGYMSVGRIMTSV